jgi:cell division protein FtsB
MDGAIASSVRRPVSAVGDIEITGKKRTRKRATSAPVKYTAKRKAKKSSSGASFSWNKLGWILCGVLFLRLIFMDSGVVDYYGMESRIQDKINHLDILKTENMSLVDEIKKIQTSPKYQRKITRNHLGVIAPNEYLVVFSKN